ncbi:MAG: lysine biosynthesis protein LysW [Candidatus Marinimicrobia bacterium]|nr:lysine biosynthesis protein LysW [Candidatus Neomarinimicrobiota bacterium]|tara:strand:+ start:24459 stop:24623 length:165 start_codon:yes stop_codon:yes gene_type:complete
MVKCIECGSTIDLPEGTVENEILDCESCGVELEVVGLNPPSVELAPEEQEDWGE